MVPGNAHDDVLPVQIPGKSDKQPPCAARRSNASFVVFASEADWPLPPPVVVRSQHGNRPVWRFLLEPTKDNPFDPNRVVRKVIAVPVTKK